MGTYYYLEFDVCKSCGRPARKLHIGKSSAGRKFLFRTYDDENIRSVKDWLKLIDASNGRIVNGYGDEIHTCDFVNMINSKVYGQSSVDEIPGLTTDGEFDYLNREFS